MGNDNYLRTEGQKYVMLSLAKSPLEFTEAIVNALAPKTNVLDDGYAIALNYYNGPIGNYCDVSVIPFVSFVNSSAGSSRFAPEPLFVVAPSVSPHNAGGIANKAPSKDFWISAKPDVKDTVGKAVDEVVAALNCG